MDVVSFTVDHDRMERGIFVSRKDQIGAETVTTFDLRLKLPNREPVLDNPAIHTLEHLLAVYLRGAQCPWSDQVIYIGPMGCRTGMYLILKGDWTSEAVVPLVTEAFSFVASFDAPIPATTSIECGNCFDHNLPMAQWEARKYLEETLKDLKKENLYYPA